MRIVFLTSLFSLSCSITMAQATYSVNSIPLPESMHKQVCISGMKYMNGKLYMASERCPAIFAFDPASKEITGKIDTQVPQVFEMEGLTSYNGKLYLISENISAVYEADPVTGDLRQVQTSTPLPPKSKTGDGTEGIAANEKHDKFYILRERNEDMTRSQIFTYRVENTKDGSPFTLTYESTIELPLENPQWRYSDICVDAANNRLICLKSYSKGKLRQQFLESLDIDANGNISAGTLKNIPVENFSEISNMYKNEDFSMNLEGITVDDAGVIYIISDNTSGKALCDEAAKEKTILLELRLK